MVVWGLPMFVRRFIRKHTMVREFCLREDAIVRGVEFLPSESRMKPLRTFVLILVLALSACTSYEGVFEPDCIAFEGDVVELSNGQLRWERFTDQRVIDNNGQVVNPFPNFPKTGRYEVRDDRVTFRNGDGEDKATWYLVSHNNALYLLTPKQRERMSSDGMPDCALRRVKADS